MALSTSVLQELESYFPFVGRLDASGLREFQGLGSAVRLAAGEPVCHEGMACSHLALVLSGRVRVFKLAENGREITLYRVESGQCCILTASCILSGRPFPAMARCETTVDAVVLPAVRVRDWAGALPPFRDFLFGFLGRRLVDLIGMVEEVVFQRLDRRLALWLEQQALDGRAATGTILTTHQSIAAELGSSREVVSRLLKAFEGEGLIRLARGRIEVLDPVALKRRSESG